MRKMWVIAVREYLAAVRTKTFIISLCIMPLMMGGSVLVQVLLRDVKDYKTQHFVVVDRTAGQAYGPILRKGAENHQNPPFDVQLKSPEGEGDQALAELRLQLSDRVRSGELLGFLEIGPDVENPLPPPADKSEKIDPALQERHGLRYQTNTP